MKRTTIRIPEMDWDKLKLAYQADRDAIKKAGGYHLSWERWLSEQIMEIVKEGQTSDE